MSESEKHTDIATISTERLFLVETILRGLENNQGILLEINSQEVFVGSGVNPKTDKWQDIYRLDCHTKVYPFNDTTLQMKNDYESILKEERDRHDHVLKKWESRAIKAEKNAVELKDTLDQIEDYGTKYKEAKKELEKRNKQHAFWPLVYGPIALFVTYFVAFWCVVSGFDLGGDISGVVTGFSCFIVLITVFLYRGRVNSER